jgi:hypothetical protein
MELFFENGNENVVACRYKSPKEEDRNKRSECPVIFHNTLIFAAK